MRIITLCLAALLLLSACGNRQTNIQPLRDALLAHAQAVISSADTTQKSDAPPITRASMTQTDQPAILVLVPSVGATAALAMVRQSGDTRTYLSVDTISLALRNGVLAGSRGFSDDLISSDHADLLANLRKGSGSHTRTLRHLDAQDQLAVTTLTCSLSAQGLRDIEILGKAHRTNVFVETCTGGDAPINNVFMIENGIIVQSAQCASPTVPQLIIQQVQ